MRGTAARGVSDAASSSRGDALWNSLTRRAGRDGVLEAAASSAALAGSGCGGLAARDWPSGTGGTGGFVGGLAAPAAGESGVAAGCCRRLKPRVGGAGLPRAACSAEAMRSTPLAGAAVAVTVAVAVAGVGAEAGSAAAGGDGADGGGCVERGKMFVPRGVATKSGTSARRSQPERWAAHT